MEKQSGIYQIKNISNNKIYIGSAINVRQRFDAHVRLLTKGKHHSRKLQNAWNKYGANIFAFSVLEHVEIKETLLEREQFWIHRFNASISGYNISPTAGSLLGHKHTDETKRKMSEVHIGKVKTPDHCANLSKANSGKKMSDEARKKMSEAKMGKQRKPHSLETRAKMSAIKVGVFPTEETRLKMAKAKIGRVLSVETKAKMSAAHKFRLKKIQII